MISGRTIIGFLIIIFCFEQTVFSQKPTANPAHQKKIPANFCLSSAEAELYHMINEYRKSYNLPPIPFSKSLSFVAKSHVRDLFFNRPDQGKCNVHSWSDKGAWKPFCYPPDEKKNNSVWDKPKEITPYNSKGYEIVYWENNSVNIDSILPFWKTIEYFNSFLVSNGKWQGKSWLAIGVGIYENYASVWFGEIADPEGEPWICGMEPKKKAAIDKPVTDSLKHAEKPVLKQQKKDIRDTIQISPGTYYIIISSQQPLEKSRQFSAELISKGYKDAKVLIKENKARVSIMEFREKQAADSALREVKKLYKDAWIYRQNNP
jgi:hypothetical protein